MLVGSETGLCTYSSLRGPRVRTHWAGVQGAVAQEASSLAVCQAFSNNA